MPSLSVDDRPFDEETNNPNNYSSTAGRSSYQQNDDSIIPKSQKILPSPVNVTTKEYFERDNDDDDDYETETHGLLAPKRLRRRQTSQKYLVLCRMYGAFGILAIMILAGIILVIRSAFRIHRLRHVTPEQQLQKLNEFTNQALLLDDEYHHHHHRHPHRNNNNTNTNNESSDFVRNMKNGCRTTLLLMRHCEKTRIYDQDGHKVKEVGDHHCSPIGYEHAEYISTLFRRNEHNDPNNNTNTQNQFHHNNKQKGKTEELLNTKNKYASPSLLYAMSPHRPRYTSFRGFRQVETLTPLSKQADIPINSQFQESQGLYLANDYFQNYLSTGKLCPDVGTTLATRTQSSSPPIVPTTTVISWKHSDIVNLAQALGCSEQNGCPSITYDKHDFDQIWVLQYEYHFHDEDDNHGISDDNGDSNNPTFSYLKSQHHQHSMGYWTLQAKVTHGGFQPPSKYQHQNK